MTGDTERPGRATLPTPDSTSSFWHREPSEVLLGHRTTSSLPTEADVVIIGSGITGASAARQLKEEYRDQNLKVVMLEAREACWGATGRNGGHCQPQLIGQSPEIAAFELRNYEDIQKYIKEHHVKCEWRALPGVHSMMDKSLFETALSNIQKVRSSHPELASQIQIVATFSQDPSLQDLQIPTAKGAFIQQHAASLWPYKLVAHVLEELIKSKALNLQTKTPVTNLQKVKDSWIVHTPRGMIAAPKVLLCTNGYTSALLPKFSDLIVPVRGIMTALIPPPSMNDPKGKHHHLEYSYGWLGNGNQRGSQDDYLVQRPRIDGGEMMFGGGHAYCENNGVGISDDSYADEDALTYLRSELPVLLNFQDQLEAAHNKKMEASYKWSGVMGYSRDELPWVGAVGEQMGGGEGLWVSAGYTGHGMPRTWLCGRGVVDLMMGKKEKVDIPDEFRCSEERFEKVKGLETVEVQMARLFGPGRRGN